VVAQQAAAVDRELITASRRRGPHRRAQLRRLRADVRRIEQLSLRLQRERGRAGADGGAARPAQRHVVLDEVHARLDLLAEAHEELRALEQASTVSDPDAVLRRIASSASPPSAAPVGGRAPASAITTAVASSPGARPGAA
jgi:hypothetical protein